MAKELTPLEDRRLDRGLCLRCGAPLKMEMDTDGYYHNCCDLSYYSSLGKPEMVQVVVYETQEVLVEI